MEKMKGDILRSVIECCYTGTCDINDDNIEYLLAAASYLIIPHLQAKCTDYLKTPGMINVKNCIGMWKIATLYAFEELERIASVIVFEHFLEVAKNEEFLQLEEPDLIDLLESERIVIDSEEDVFNALVDWVEFFEERKPMFNKLLKVVRINLLKESVGLKQYF